MISIDIKQFKGIEKEYKSGLATVLTRFRPINKGVALNKDTNKPLDKWECNGDWVCGIDPLNPEDMEVSKDDRTRSIILQKKFYGNGNTD